MVLAIGLVFIVIGIIRIRREPRRFSNGLCLSLGVLYSIRGGKQLWDYFSPGLGQKFGDNSYELTESGSAQGLILIASLICLFILGIILLVMGIRLLRKEKLCLAHFLPIMFGLFCLIYPYFAIVKPFQASGTFTETVRNAFYLFVKSCALYIPFMIFTYFLYALVYAVVRKKKKPDYIIILGARLIGRRVSPLLARRLDKGIQIYRQYGEEPKLIVSGGQGNDEVCSEAEAMAAYLLENEIPKEQILLENQSTNTMQNLRFSKKIIEEETKADYYCNVVTNNYHVLRSVIYARAAGIPCSGYGCKTALYYLPAAALREAIAFIVGYKKLAFAAVGLFFLEAILRVILL